MERKLKKNLYILIIMNSALIIFAVIYTVYFRQSEGTAGEIDCYFREKFGIYCPGCGGSRSLSAFMSLNLLESFLYYPAICVGAVCVLEYDIRLVITIIKKDSALTDKYRFYTFILIPAAIIINYLTRIILLLCFNIHTL